MMIVLMNHTKHLHDLRSGSYKQEHKAKILVYHFKTDNWYLNSLFLLDKAIGVLCSLLSKKGVVGIHNSCV